MHLLAFMLRKVKALNQVESTRQVAATEKLQAIDS